MTEPEERAGADEQLHRATLDAAVVAGDDSWARQEREYREMERQRIEREERERRDVIGLDARSAASLSQSRSDAVKSAATVGAVGFAGFLLGGPVGAVVGGVAGWLYDKCMEDV